MTLVCSTSLIIALLTASLLPTDVILVSFMKYPNGTFKVPRYCMARYLFQIVSRRRIGQLIRQHENIFKDMSKWDIMVGEEYSSNDYRKGLL